MPWRNTMRISDLIEQINLITKLVKNDLKSRYSGSAFGMVWAYVQPLVTVLVFWYVFQVGFKNPPVDNIEYILWFIAGYIPWIYFNDSVLASTNVFYEYSYLVMKMKFKVWQLPIIKVLSSLCIHMFFILFIIAMYFLYGYTFQLSWISILYYSFCITTLLFGLSFFVASLSVFIKDASQMVGIILQIGFWLTPIFWSDNSMNENVLHILKFNPLYYVINGYRDALISGIGFWHQPLYMTAYFWGCVVIVILIGAKVYNNLKGHFADLL
jgi:ABC-type polysaccharide/polyol phosphate export permease